MIINNGLCFIEEKAVQESPINSPWKILIADDDDEVHAVTRLVLNDFEFDHRRLEFISAFSGSETIKMIQTHPDIALLLLDVVMEEDDSGLKITRYIREVLKNRFIRIILRTGHPGQAPENKVIFDYDINDYKEKTELTSQKLFTTVMSALRAYRDICNLNHNKMGLEKVIEMSGKIMGLQTLTHFTTNVMNHLPALLNNSVQSEHCRMSGLAIQLRGDRFQIFAGSGDFARCHPDQTIFEVLDTASIERIKKAAKMRSDIFNANEYIGIFRSGLLETNILYFTSNQRISEMEQDLVRLFATNIAIAYDNIYLNQELEETQKEVILTLGELIESRSKEVRNHVKRVAAFSHLIALKFGLAQLEADILKFAAPMHDVGKIGIPDAILNKPSRLTPSEFEIMKTHTNIGYDILKKSDREILKAAAIIALQHHENWDGSGYPNQLHGEEIHIYGRITQIADIFDALSHSRVYKHAWKISHVVEELKKVRGKQLDPMIVDVFLNNLDDILAIKKKYPDDSIV